MMLRIWNRGHDRETAKLSLKVGKHRRVFNLFAPMVAACIGDMLGRSHRSRTFRIEMRPYEAHNKPARMWNRPRNKDGVAAWEREFDAVYAYVRKWAETTELNLNPPMPEELERRFGQASKRRC